MNKETTKVTLVAVRETRTVYRGLSQAAKQLRVTPAHLSYVLHGQRRASSRLRRGLARLGVTVTSSGVPFEDVKG